VGKATVIYVKFLHVIKMGHCLTELFKKQKWHVFMVRATVCILRCSTGQEMTD